MNMKKILGLIIAIPVAIAGLLLVEMLKKKADEEGWKESIEGKVSDMLRQALDKKSQTNSTDSTDFH